MVTRLIDKGWLEEIRGASRESRRSIKIICPFVKARAITQLLPWSISDVQVITRLSVADFAAGVSDVDALISLLEAGATIRGVRNLHSKLYIFDSRTALITSANLTLAALTRNHEFGLLTDEGPVVDASSRYFGTLWNKSASAELTLQAAEDLLVRVGQERAVPGLFPRGTILPDYGADAGFEPDASGQVSVVAAEGKQAFVKFFGQSANRASLSSPILSEVDAAECHWALSYPKAKRPRAVRDGAEMFIARLTREPRDIRIFGRAIGLAYVAVRDDATETDIERRPFKAIWSRYIRVFQPEFVAGDLANGVSLSDLMDALGPNSFASTQRNLLKGRGNIDPRKAYLEQPAVELSQEGHTWLAAALQSAFARHGVIPRAALETLSWPPMVRERPTPLES